MDFSKKLHLLRIERGISQKKLAEYLGVAQSSVNYWEKGQRIPSVSILKNIADYFNISLDEMFDVDLPIKKINNTENALLKKYRLLDEHGKEIIDFVLEKEWERCENAAKNTGTAAKIAALESANYLNAAHDLGATEEQKTAADQLMQDDSEWE